MDFEFNRCVDLGLYVCVKHYPLTVDLAFAGSGLIPIIGEIPDF